MTSRGPPRSPLGRAWAGLVGVFEGIGKVAAAIGGVLAVAAALGVYAATGDDDSEPPPTPTPTATATAAPPRAFEVDPSQITAATTTAVLGRQGDNDYVPDNLLDGDPRTAWVEGEPGLGPGSRLVFTLPRRVELVRLRVINGYAKDTASQLDNAAARTLLITTDATSSPIRRRLARDGRPQTITGPFGTTRRVEIEIADGYPGDEFDDLAMSEIAFIARDA